ncbi:MAG TPA: rRNA maturation RNase YbeY [Candidatus Polarisedimenticolia bacterium]|nr:rRNA maturation RNase YbeY [Candidatus Polarisedimenticolia bacterium]
MSGSLLIKNRQRAKKINTRLLKTLTKTLLRELLGLKTFDLVIYLVGKTEMAGINEKFLQHNGPTDVITFDYCSLELGTWNLELSPLHGEIFICPDVALTQSRQFRASWQSELARYVIHGVLHLRGFDDLSPAKRRKMKREENRLLREVARLFPLSKLGVRSKLAP